MNKMGTMDLAAGNVVGGFLLCLLAGKKPSRWEAGWGYEVGGVRLLQTGAAASAGVAATGAATSAGVAATGAAACAGVAAPALAVLRSALAALAAALALASLSAWVAALAAFLIAALCCLDGANDEPLAPVFTSSIAG